MPVTPITLRLAPRTINSAPVTIDSYSQNVSFAADGQAIMDGEPEELNNSFKLVTLSSSYVDLDITTSDTILAALDAAAALIPPKEIARMEIIVAPAPGTVFAARRTFGLKGQHPTGDDVVDLKLQQLTKESSVFFDIPASVIAPETGFEGERETSFQLTTDLVALETIRVTLAIRTFTRTISRHY